MVDIYKSHWLYFMDKPINQITGIKGLEELKTYLQERSELNLSILLDRTNSSLLHFAAFKNDLPRMKIFIKHFKQFTQAHHGTGLYTGTSTFRDKLKAWVDSANKQGYTAVMYAALHGNLQMIQFLEECGTNMQYRTTKSENILFMCVEHNKIKPLIYLIESNHKYDVNQPNINGDTILHQACRKGYTQIVSYLLTIGGQMEARNNDNETPLIAATRELKKQVIKLLLIKGADREAQDKNGEKCLQIARVNQREDLIRILDNNYGACDKIKIKCNKKIVYEPENPSYTYSIYFIVLFHLFFLPANLLSEFDLVDEKYVKMIPLMFEGIYEVIILIIYFLLLRKTPRKAPRSLMEIDGSFCAECKSEITDKMFHCYICRRCIHRYDHHCPWINNCVGSHNVGKFTLFLFVLLLGLIEVTFCSICLLLGEDNQNFVRYRKSLEVPDWVHLPLNILTIVFSVFLIFGLLNLLIAQLRNLFTNETSFERQKKEREGAKKAELLASETSLNESLNNDIEDETEVTKSSCCGNCMDMLSQNYS